MRSTSGSCTCAIMSRIALARARAREIGVARSTSSIWRPTGSTGLSAVIGSWKIIAMRLARNCAQPAVAGGQQFLAAQQDAAAGGTSDALRQQPHEVERGHRFAGAALADQAQRLARADAEARCRCRIGSGRRFAAVVSTDEDCRR